MSLVRLWGFGFTAERGREGHGKKREARGTIRVTYIT